MSGFSVRHCSSHILVDCFPLDDCHGNMVATVARTGAGFVTSNVRTYDVWGGVRTGASTGGPKGRYVANLGHVQDDESDLIYMRARYYEPESGRFISEDPARDGNNWFAYCNSNPTNTWDRSGEAGETIGSFIGALNRVLEFLEMTFGISIPAASELFLKVAATALEIAGYEAKREVWALSAWLARGAAAMAAASGQGWAALGLNLASVGFQIGCVLMRGLQAMALYSLGVEIHLYFALEGE